MTIEWLRDLVIIIMGLVVTCVLILIALMSYSLYHRTRGILDSMHARSKTVQDVSYYVGDQILKPVIEVIALVQGVRQGILTLSKFFKRSEGGKKNV